MIIESVNFTRFCDAFYDMDCDSNFTYDGKRALFDYLEELSDDMGEHIKLDVIGLCCEYSEMGVDEFIKYYDVNVADGADINEKTADVKEYLDNNAGWYTETCIGTFVFYQF